MLMKVRVIEPRIDNLELNNKTKKTLYELRDQLTKEMISSVLDEIEHIINELEDLNDKQKYPKIMEFLGNFQRVKEHVVFPFIKNTNYKQIRIKADEVLNEMETLREVFPELSVPEIVEYFNANRAKQLEMPIIKINKKLKNIDKILTDIKFWRRKLRSIANQEIEKAYFLLGLIGKRDKLTSKDIQQKFRSEEKIANKRFGIDEQKKHQRRFEQYRCFLNGMIKYAREKNLLCAFITITVPSEYHLKIARKNLENFLTPEEVNSIIGTKWNAINKKISTSKYEILGCKAVEPHKDCTPHWHMMMWYEEKHKSRLEQLFNQKFSDFIQVRKDNVLWEKFDHKQYKEQKKERIIC